MSGFKIPSRNRKVIDKNPLETVCPYCKHKQFVTDETEDDYIIIGNTKVNYCRKCGWEFVNGVTKDIEYKYS